MNKFYENYKDLFVEQNKYRPSNSLIQRSQKQDYSRDFYSRHQYGRNLLNNNPMDRQFKKLFNQFTVNDSKYIRLKTQESLAEKQLKEVILPKLYVYDKQIQRKIKRFKTQEKSRLNHSNLYQNQSCLYPQNTKQNQFRKISNKRIKTQNFHKYKYGPLRFIQNIQFNQGYQVGQSQNQFRSSLKPAGKPSINLNQIILQLNPQNQNLFDKNKQKILKSSVLIHQNQDYSEQNQRILETQYQRSYSNKKIHRKQLQKDPIIQTFSILSNKNYVPNFHKLKSLENQKNNFSHSKNQGIFQDQVKKKQIEFLVNDQEDKQYHIRTRLNSNHLLQNQKETEQSSQKIGIKVVKRRKNQRSMKLNFTSQEGLKFSQYENQYAFVNKRMEDIQYFNNYYSHNCINSYKKAIIRRLDAKKSQEQRRIKLKNLLINEQLNYQN